MVALVKLVAKDIDFADYTTYVFKCLEDYMIKKTPYIMCTKFPNWNSRTINIGDIGYLECMEIRAGIDKWFNGKDFIPYNYNNIQFIRFVEKKDEEKEYVM